MRKRLRVRGYTDFGTVEVPPMPPCLLMVDRVTGDTYWLTYDGSTDPVPPGEGGGGGDGDADWIVGDGTWDDTLLWDDTALWADDEATDSAGPDDEDDDGADESFDPAGIVFSSTLPSRAKVKTTYGPFDGPYLNGNIRLYAQSGVLLGEFVSDAIYKNGRVCAVKASSKVVLEVTAPVTWIEGNSFTYTLVDVTE